MRLNRKEEAAPCVPLPPPPQFVCQHKVVPVLGEGPPKCSHSTCLPSPFLLSCSPTSHLQDKPQSQIIFYFTLFRGWDR